MTATVLAPEARAEALEVLEAPTSTLPQLLRALEECLGRDGKELGGAFGCVLVDRKLFAAVRARAEIFVGC